MSNMTEGSLTLMPWVIAYIIVLVLLLVALNRKTR